MTPEELSAWVCESGCNAQRWEHELWASVECVDGLVCPPPPEPRDCCGRLAGRENEELRRCSNDACQAWWCLCGTFTGMSSGPVGCGCEYDRGEVSTESPEKSS